MRVPAFWDTSALVPLCVRQSITPACVKLYKSHIPVVWWATPIEIVSAVARLLRMQQISSGDYARAGKFAQTLADSWLEVQPSNSLRRRAVQLIYGYHLRAADAFQLAAALQWCEDAPQGRVFFSADERLCEAALRCGFEAPPIV